MNMIEKRLARVEELARQLGSDCARCHGARVNIIETYEAGMMVERSGERCPDCGSPQVIEVHTFTTRFGCRPILPLGSKSLGMTGDRGHTKAIVRR